MTSEQIVHYMGRDFSQFLPRLLDSREYADFPADTYFDIICDVFGDEPTRESVIDGFKSGSAISALRERLSTFFENPKITNDAARQLLETTIRNNFGADALK
jgi:hypothetical protein